MSTVDTGTSMRAVVQHEFGGPDVLRIGTVDRPLAGPGEVLIRVSAAGVNFADVHGRTTGMNHFAAPFELPFVPGGEVAGTRADTGERVVALCGSGGYAEWAVASEDLSFAIPDGVDDAAALALLVQGLTAWYLLRVSAPLRRGESVVVHGASGGVGALLVQLARSSGAGRIIGTSGSDAGRTRITTLGADAAVSSASDDLVGDLRAANDGAPVDVVFDMIGGAVFDASLAALAPFGRLVVYGASSGTGGTVNARGLIPGSRSVSGFWLMDALRRPAEAPQAMTELFDLLRCGQLRPVIGPAFALAEAGVAQDALVGRTATGKLILDPSR